METFYYTALRYKQHSVDIWIQPRIVQPWKCFDPATWNLSSLETQQAPWQKLYFYGEDHSSSFCSQFWFEPVRRNESFCYCSSVIVCQSRLSNVDEKWFQDLRTHVLGQQEKLPHTQLSHAEKSLKNVWMFSSTSKRRVLGMRRSKELSVLFEVLSRLLLSLISFQCGGKMTLGFTDRRIGAERKTASHSTFSCWKISRECLNVFFNEQKTNAWNEMIERFVGPFWNIFCYISSTLVSNIIYSLLINF